MEIFHSIICIRIVYSYKAILSNALLLYRVAQLAQAHIEYQYMVLNCIKPANKIRFLSN